MSMSIGMLNADVPQPPDAYALDKALREWRHTLERQGAFKSAFPGTLPYTQCYLRHSNILRALDAVIASDVEVVWHDLDTDK